MNAHWALRSVIPPYYDDAGNLWDGENRQPMELHRIQGTDNNQYGSTLVIGTFTYTEDTSMLGVVGAGSYTSIKSVS